LDGSAFKVWRAKGAVGNPGINLKGFAKVKGFLWEREKVE